LLNYELINNRINQIRKSLNRLKKLAELNIEYFLADQDNFAIAEHHLRRALEALFDIGRHILAKRGYGRPADYRSVIIELGRNGVIPNDFAEKIKGIAGYRNRLVHVYAEVTEEEIYDIISTKLADIEEFCKFIIDYINKDKAQGN